MNKKLILDIGNTFTKYAVFNEEKIESFQLLNDEDLKTELQSNTIEKAIISSVRTKAFTESVAKHLKNALILSSDTPLPVSIKYSTPETLGNDRIANVVGAWSENPGKNNLVIDAGTCLKFDFINEKNEYLGGSISPGLQMRFKALHTLTDNLPLIEDMNWEQLTGNSTKSSIQAGVIGGIVSEIEGLISKYASRYSDLKVFFTGGDSETIVSLVRSQKNSIFADKFITLKGLNTILVYNEKI